MAAAPIDPKDFALYVARLQGAQTQRAFLSDLNEVTGWNVDHTRLSRYVRGELPVGRSVRERFETYAKARDLPLYETQKPAAMADIAAAIERQTDVFRALIEETQREAREAKRRADLLERLVVSLLAPAVEASPDPAAIRVMREWGEAALANMTSRLPAADPAG